MRLVPLMMLLAALPIPVQAQALSTIECAAYGPMLNAAGESVKGLARGAREIDLGSVRSRVGEETRQAIARLEDANANLQPVMAEWAAAAADLAARLQKDCSR
ncbi:hypothetical protein [uncultured Enterovirga sp.]|uniref:hypothetical protein n=1 Tax=uncultured Enterovirga sp. TaxID=2026352 RepID=UPI0035CB817A